MSTKNKLAKSKPPSTAQYLDIAEIKDDVVIMKDSTLRGVLMCSSVNFALKSEDEQNATIQAYIQFLNSLEFPVQIVIQSRKLNIDGYLEKLKAAEKQQTNELLRVQISEYVAYINELISLGDIMTKRFFAVVPYNPSSDTHKGFWQRLKSVMSAAGVVQLSRDEFEKYTEALEQRINFVTSGLSSMGVKSARLDTQSLIELYYNTYNPDLKEQEKLTKVEELRVETN